MDSTNRYDELPKSPMFRSSYTRAAPDEGFFSTFQPSGNSNFPDNRSQDPFTKYTDEYKRFLDSQNFDSRNKSSLGLDRSLYQSG